MSDGAMQEIESYLRRLRAALRSLSPEEAEDIVKEIGSHLRESAGTPEGAAENVAAVLERLGSPTDLASRFTTYSMARKAERSGSPWLALRTIFRWAALSVRGVGALVISLAGYGLALSFLLAGLAKPFNRDRVGLWKLSDPAGSWSLHLGFGAAPEGKESLGWWIVPLGLGLGLALLWLTARFGLRSVRELRRTLEVPVSDAGEEKDS